MTGSNTSPAQVPASSTRARAQSGRTVRSKTDGRTPAASRVTSPSLRLERLRLRAGATLVAGMDEVGRGCLAGPVTVGVCVVDASTRTAPAGLRDSKLLTADTRLRLVPAVQRWAVAWGVGHAEAAEIDRHGIVGALRLAGRRALSATGVRPDHVLLDGTHDWLTDPVRVGLFAQNPTDDQNDHDEHGGSLLAPPVETVRKGDLTCSSIAGASVLAKVTRDALMARRHVAHPAYEWAVNKGYGTSAHREALQRLGACEEHRRTWNLGLNPGLNPGLNAGLNPGAADRLGESESLSRG